MKIDRYMLRGVWQALNCLSIHATFCVIIAGASPRETKMWAAVRYVKTAIFFALAVRITGKLLKIDGYMLRGVYAARGLASTELSFHSCNVLRDCHRGVPRANKNEGLGT